MGSKCLEKYNIQHMIEKIKDIAARHDNDNRLAST